MGGDEAVGAASAVPGIVADDHPVPETERRPAARGMELGRALRPRVKVLPEQARAHNRSLVLQTLYRAGRQSRADLARETGLTRVTISDLISDLIADGLVLELGQRDEARPGKPAVLLDVNRGYAQIIGIDLSEHQRFRGAVLDMDGTVLQRAELPLDDAKGADAVGLVVRLVDTLLPRATAPVLGIGIGSPGIVNPHGVIVSAPNLRWNAVDLHALVADHTGAEVFVANDANAAVLAEHGFGGAHGDMMLVKIGHGVGSGLLVAGALVYGSRYAAGEIGQVVVGTDAPLETAYDGDRSLESWLAVPRLNRRVAEARAEGLPEASVLEDAGRRLGIVLAPIVGALNLAEVVLSGPDELLDGPLLEAVRQSLNARTMAGFHTDVTLRMTSLGRDIVVRGAAVMVLSGLLGVS